MHESNAIHTPNWQLGWQWLIVNVLVWVVAFSTPVIETLNWLASDIWYRVGNFYSPNLMILIVFLVILLGMTYLSQYLIVSRYNIKFERWSLSAGITFVTVLIGVFVLFHIIALVLDKDFHWCGYFACINWGLGLYWGHLIGYYGSLDWHAVPLIGLLVGVTYGLALSLGQQRCLRYRKRDKFIWFVDNTISCALALYLMFYFHATLHYVWARLLVSCISGLIAGAGPAIAILMCKRFDASDDMHTAVCRRERSRVLLSAIIVCCAMSVFIGLRPCGWLDRTFGISGCYATLSVWGMTYREMIFSPDSTLLATRTGPSECAVRLWQVSDGRLLRKWQQPSQYYSEFQGIRVDSHGLMGCGDIFVVFDDDNSISIPVDSDYVEVNINDDWISGAGQRSMSWQQGDFAPDVLSPDGEVRVTVNGGPTAFVVHLWHVRDED